MLESFLSFFWTKVGSFSIALTALNLSAWEEPKERAYVSNICTTDKSVNWMLVKLSPISFVPALVAASSARIWARSNALSCVVRRFLPNFHLRLFLTSGWGVCATRGETTTLPPPFFCLSVRPGWSRISTRKGRCLSNYLHVGNIRCSGAYLWSREGTITF